ncbi:hypothetical protein ABMA27_008716 [Loxostege sticticalis]
MWSCTRDFMRSSHYMSEAYAWFGAAYFFYDIWSMYMVHVQMLNSAELKSKLQKKVSKNGDLSLSSGDSCTSRKKSPPSFLEYCRYEPVILFHHLFIGGFGFLVIVYFRGEFGDCTFGFVYLMELSTPFVSLRGILSRLRLKATRLYVLNGVLMLLTFLVCRVLSLPYVCLLYSHVRGLPYFEVSSRIVSGWEADPGQHPHFVALRLVNPNGATFGCGASLVHRHWAISAAHCTARREYVVVRTGVVVLTQPELIQETREWYNHPTFREHITAVQPNDISLLKLPQRVTYTRLTQPIRLQSRRNAFANYNNVKLVASGHGATWTNGIMVNHLRWVYLRGVTNSRCSRNFAWGTVTANTICAQSYNVSSQSICTGDSGGPLVHVDNGVPTLVGVSSFVSGWGCHTGRPAEAETDKPAGSTEQPEAETDKPAGSTEQPETETDKPAGSTEQPETETDKPAGSTQQPETETDKPVGSTEQPETETDKPAGSTEQPETETDKPAGSTQTPEVETDRPTDSTQQPDIETDRPTDSTQAPDLETEAPPSTSSPPITQAPDEDESNEDSDENSDSSEETEDPVLKEMLKRLEVLVKVKIRMSKLGKKLEHSFHHNKTIEHHRQN